MIICNEIQSDHRQLQSRVIIGNGIQGERRQLITSACKLMPFFFTRANTGSCNPGRKPAANNDWRLKM